MTEPITFELVRCELCGLGSAPELYRVDDSGHAFRIVRCAVCGLVYVNPQPDTASMARFYPPEYYGEGANKFRAWIEWLRRHDRRRLAAAIARTLPRGGRVIDFGCGRGEILRLLAARGFTGCGVERPEAASAAHPVPGVEILAGEEATRRLADGVFDLALFLHSLEHLPHPLAALREAHRVLKADGRLLLVTPNVRSFQAIFGGRHWFHLEVPRHLHLFSPGTLQRLLESAGFEVMHVGHFSFEQNPFGALQTALNLLGFRRNHLYEALKSGGGEHRRASALEVAAGALLAYPALVFSTLGSLYQRGATITVRARKKRQVH